MPKKNDGKKSEEIVRVILKSYQETAKGFFTRLYDTGSTGAKGGFIPSQVADFIGVIGSVAYAIEVKSSITHSSMLKVPKSYVRASQIVQGRLFIRAGGRGLFIFHSLKDNVFEAWDTSDVIEWVLREEKLTEYKRKLAVKGKEALKIKLLEVLNED